MWWRRLMDQTGFDYGLVGYCLTEAGHYRIFDDMEELSCVDPMTLLPCHQHLLELDLGSFGDCSSRQRQLWITKILSAISATEKVLSGKFVSQGLTNLMTPRNPPTRLCRSALGSKVHKSTTRCTTIMARSGQLLTLPEWMDFSPWRDWTDHVFSHSP